MPTKSRTRKSGPRLKDVDALFSRYVRARDGACQVRGWKDIECAGSLQAAHCVSRRYHGTRWNEDNCHALCQAHHLYETHHPLEGRAMWIGLLGEDLFEELCSTAMHHRGKMDFGAIASDLREKLKEMEEMEE